MTGTITEFIFFDNTLYNEICNAGYSCVLITLLYKIVPFDSV
jgi:hypothetical protein